MKGVLNELQHKNSKIELFKYILIGVLTNIFYYCIFLVSVYLVEIHYSFSVIISYISSVIVGYYFNSKFSFKVFKKENFLKYLIVYFTSMIINISLLYFFVNFLIMEVWIAQGIGTFFIAAFNFLALKFFVYKTQHVKQIRGFL
jgi:putative flippase GtrA